MTQSTTLKLVFITVDAFFFTAVHSSTPRDQGTTSLVMVAVMACSREHTHGALAGALPPMATSQMCGGRTSGHSSQNGVVWGRAGAQISSRYSNT